MLFSFRTESQLCQRCLHWTLTTSIMASFPNEHALWQCYFNGSFSCNTLPNIVAFTSWLVFLLLTAALDSAPGGFPLVTAQSNVLCSHPTFPQVVATRFPSSKPERARGTDSPLASKHCDSQYFPKTTSILSPCLQTNRQRF